MIRSKKAVLATTAENNRGISGHMITLHKRLYHALSLGTRFYDEKQWKWQCTDIEIQRHVVRSIALFLDSISGDTSYHPLVKDSVNDIVEALIWILLHKSEATLSMAANVAIKLIRIIPISILQQYLLDLVHPLSLLLSSHLLEVSVSCATSLNIVFSNMSMKREKEKEVWEILIATETVFRIVSNIREFSVGTMSIEYFEEMASLLSTILHWWPPSRYSVWNDIKLMAVLEVMGATPDFSVKIALLKLYSGIALCGNGAKKLLENGEALLEMMVLCMGRSCPHSVRMEAFRLAQCLAASQQGCLKMMSMCCEPIVRAIINGMSGWISHSGKIASDQMSLLVEACRLALIIRWAGEHHDCFWKLGIDRILLDLLLRDFHDGPSQKFCSLEEQIARAQEGLMAKFLLVLRPYVWDILGWLATHCKEDFDPNMHHHELCMNMLITCACLSFADTIQKGCQISQSDVADTFRGESVSRAVLMMIYSPCKYIASKSRSVLSEILKPTSKKDLKHLLCNLHITSSWKTFGKHDILQTCINLLALTCYSGLPQYQSQIVKSGGINILLACLSWCLSNDNHIGRLSLAPRLHYMFSERTCCWVCKDDWEGNDVLLFYCLWGLAELLQSGTVRNNLDIFAGQVEYTEAQFVSTLQEICIRTSAPGLKWYAAYILSYIGFYGFPCTLGKRIGKALNETEYADVELIFANGDSISVHGVILAIRCQSLLPPEQLLCIEKASDGSSVRHDAKKLYGKFLKEIQLSSHVDNQAIGKLLEYIYLGYLHAGEELLNKLKILAKHCSLQNLLMMLKTRHPKWGSPFPSYDLTLALTPAGVHFSDIILEAKATESVCWACSVCSLSVPHIHAHKVVLWSSCEYMRALFQSGMLESRSETIKVPVSWEALTKLVNWFYTDELPNPPSGCLWANMDTEERLLVLEPYLEICWLAEFWSLDDIQTISYEVIVSCLDSARVLSIKIIEIAANFSLWKLVEVAASYLAPLYHQLCHSGALEALDEELIDIIRSASVRLSQEG